MSDKNKTIANETAVETTPATTTVESAAAAPVLEAEAPAVAEAPAAAPLDERYVNAVERAAQYKMFGEGVSALPVTVGNISNYRNAAGEERTIINFNAKTARCVGGPLAHEHRRPAANASYDQPASWNLKFQTGDSVFLFIANGYVKKIMPLTAQVGKQIQYSKPTSIATGNGETADVTTGEVSKAAVSAADDEELPF